MSQLMTIPLFVLPSAIFPSVSETLRVFEPRYKQMLDDCAIDEKQFGYIAQNPEIDSIDGWPQPSSFGVLCSIDDLWERGTNIIFTANANQRFELLEVVHPALPSIPFGDIYPTVDDLVDQYIEESPQGKLYLRATIRLLDDLEGECSSEDWSSFLHDWAHQIVDVNSIFGSMDIDFEQKLLLSKTNFFFAILLRYGRLPMPFYTSKKIVNQRCVHLPLTRCSQYLDKLFLRRILN